MSITVIIPSAGVGARMKTNQNKIFLKINGESILYRTLSVFADLSDVEKVIIPCRVCDEEKIKETAKRFANLNIVTVIGGQTRAESVKNALQACDSKYVLIHDCARPFVSKELVKRVYEKTVECGSAIPVLPCTDTIKKVNGEKVESTEDRRTLFGVQTPQGFLTENLKKAYENTPITDLVTDDAFVCERFFDVFVVNGEKNNIKITTAEDLPKTNQVGVGFDAHRFEKGREMWLGGVKLDCDYGLLGHSDADVVLHAVMDALLSSVHLRDIGVQFPCTPEFKDISSRVLFERVMEMLDEKGAEIVNISVVIVAERPKLAMHIEKITESIANLAKIAPAQVSITATTTEKLGFTGREEGIATEAVCMVRV